VVRNKTYNKFYRLAFTMIELIFAIVIISIAVISLPIMTKITEKGIEEGILQEAIFAGSAELMGASAAYWDTNSMLDRNVSHISRVIDIGSTCEDNTSSTRHRLRPGHIAQALHRRCVDDNTGTLAVASDANYPDLNDEAHASQNIFIDLTTEATGYKQTYKSVVTVAVNAANSNIKDITVRVTNSANDRNITILRMQSANIGEIDYFKRRF